MQPATLQVDIVQSLPCAALQKHEGCELKSLRANESHYRVRLMAMTGSASARFGTVNVDSSLQNPENERLLKNEFFLAAVDGLHCSPCIQKFATSGVASTK